MNTTKALQELLRNKLKKNTLHHIFSESPLTTPFLSKLCVEFPDFVRTLPCSNTSMLSLAMGVAISGGKVLLSLSTDDDIETLCALLNEETYGPEFPLAVTLLVPSSKPCSTTLPYAYCRKGTQLVSQLKKALSGSSIQLIGYSPSALLDAFKEEDDRENVIHQNGHQISVLTCGHQLQQALKFAQSHNDVELIEIVSLTPLHKSELMKSIHKTGRVLLIDPPEHLLPAVIDLAFWHLEAQPVIPRDSSSTNLEQLRQQLLEP